MRDQFTLPLFKLLTGHKDIKSIPCEDYFSCELSYFNYIIMASQKTCSKCSGRFGVTMFKDINVLVCRFCRIIEQQNRIIEQGKVERDQLNAKLETANGKIESLSKELKTLQEFTLANVGVTPSSDEMTSVAASVSPTSAPDSVQTHDEFQIVRNNVRPKPREMVPTICQNRFQILTDTPDEEEEEVRLVGDSIIGGQLVEFCARAPKKRKNFCFRGGRIDDVVDAVGKVSDQAPPNTTYVVHVGTNDVLRCRSEELLAKYKTLIQSFKDKSQNVIISGIIPRMGVNQRFSNIATSTNRRLANLCREEGIEFVDTWNSFYYDRSLFSKDGVHLNQVGAARFGRLLNDVVVKYRSKNGRAAAQGET